MKFKNRHEWSISVLEVRMITFLWERWYRNDWESSVWHFWGSVQSLSHIWLGDPMNCSTPGLSVHRQLPEFIYILWVGDAIQLSHPLSSPSPAAFSLSQHQGLFQWVSSSHQVAKVLKFQLQHQSFQWVFRTDYL